MRLPARTEALILWFTILVSVVLYVVVMRAIFPYRLAPNPQLVFVLIAVSFAVAASSFLVKSRLFDRAEATANPALRRTGFIVALVLCESAALMGVVAWFLTGSPQSYYPVLIGFVGILLHYPPRES